MKEPQLIATTNPQARANPMIWEGEEAAEGVFLGVEADDPLAVLGTPALELPRAPRLPEDFDPSPALRDWLSALQEALADASRDSGSRILSLDPLDDLARQAVLEILGSGEVQGSVTLDGVRYEISEAVLPGVWRLTGRELAEHGLVQPSDARDYIEVATLPQVVVDAAQSLQRSPFDVPSGPGLMNAPAVLAEISDRAAQWCAGDETHVVNFTLLPMSDADQSAIRELLGRADLELESGGFGQCRVFATRYRHVWAVQYLNALGHIILDTLEVGPPPGAIAAAQQDFEDSGARLREILQAYLT